jgi:hypothetical protein
MPPTHRSLGSLRSLGMTFRLACRGQAVVMSFRISHPHPHKEREGGWEFLIPHS